MKIESNTFKAQVVCPHCGTTSIFQAKQLIDTVRDPRAVEKVLDASWFMHTCPACGERQTVLFSCLFHDAQERILYAYADDEADYETFQGYLMQKFDESDQLGEVLNGWVNSCTCRVTNNFASFQEKLLLAYLGLDDRAIEICKYMTEMILVQTGMVADVEHMYFNSDGDKWVLLIDVGEEEMASTDLPKEMYQDILETVLPGMEIEKNQVVFDQEWVRNTLGRQTAA